MSSRLTDAQLDGLFDQMPVLAGRPRQLEELSGGLTNRNVKVTTADGVYVARAAPTPPPTCWASTATGSTHNTRAAEQAGVGAPVIDYRPDLGIMLLGYLDGRTLCNEDFQRAGMIAKAAAGCRALHAGPRFRGRLRHVRAAAGYLKTVLDNGFRMPADYLDHADTFDGIARVLDGDGPDHRAVQQRSAGRQLHRRRRQDVADRLRVLRQQRPLLRARQHLERVPACPPTSSTSWSTRTTADRLRHKTARAHLQGIVAKYGWTLWGCIQNGSSAIDSTSGTGRWSATKARSPSSRARTSPGCSTTCRPRLTDRPETSLAAAFPTAPRSSSSAAASSAPASPIT